MLYTVIAPGTDPYCNLALEELLLSRVPKDGIILYLWQNDHTVVIGRNQNPWTECRLSRMEQDNARLARRLSGGGAVYHDLGNLNFTFLCAEQDFDIQKQLLVVQTAAGYHGIPAEFSGRNDLLAAGCKFSGNAFYHAKGFAYHHGTLLIRSDLEQLQRYLSPPKAKLESKGIASVRSRVINLSELSPSLSCQQMQESMIRAFAQVYGGTPCPLPLPEEEQIRQAAQRFASHDWLLGKPMPFTCSMEGHFPWGHLQLQLQVENGLIQDLAVYTDAMDTELPEKLCAAMRGCPFRLEELAAALQELPNADAIVTMLKQQMP